MNVRREQTSVNTTVIITGVPTPAAVELGLGLTLMDSAVMVSVLCTDFRAGGMRGGGRLVKRFAVRIGF
jgi:hypothetical protein